MKQTNNLNNNIKEIKNTRKLQKKNNSRKQRPAIHMNQKISNEIKQKEHKPVCQ